MDKERNVMMVMMMMSNMKLKYCQSHMPALNLCCLKWIRKLDWVMGYLV